MRVSEFTEFKFIQLYIFSIINRALGRLIAVFLVAICSINVYYANNYHKLTVLELGLVRLIVLVS